MAPRASQADGRVSGTRAEDRQGRWRQMVIATFGSGILYPSVNSWAVGYKRPSLFVQALVAFASEAFVDAGIKPRVQAHFIPACISIRLGEP
ncbi:hypothetical protein VDGE_30460 [Verticillium dahliae]|uniref:Uncharacterized protein n=1 Tax=Verticillium dahliae TaxID=27337 RepID=A0A444RXQ2_VERDA|nr:hypothetical protein VDGE_30460 [Verticillium dahliae]